MPILLYYASYSAPCKAVLLTAKVLQLDVEIKNVDLEHLEHMSLEFTQINPQHKVPVLVDEDGFTLSESRAIMAYLVEKYAPNSTLHPKDLHSRARINHMLFFDMGTLYQRCLNYYTPIWKKAADPDPYHFAKLQEVLKYLDMFLKDREYFAGDHMTIADISIAASVSLMLEFKLDLKYESIKRWYEKMKTSIPEFDEVATNKVEIMKLKRF